MQSISVKYVMIRYLCVFITVTIAAGIFIFALDFFFGDTSLGTGGASVISIILPALDAGTTIYKKWQVKLQGKELWKLASLLTLEHIAVIVLVAVFIVFFDTSYFGLSSTTIIGIIFTALTFAAVIVLIITRIFLSMGMKQGEKLHQKQTKDIF